MTDDYQPVLAPDQILRLAEALEGPADVTAFAITGEKVMRDATLIANVLTRGWTARQDGDEWVVLTPEGIEGGRIFDRMASPTVRTDG